jgi:hypothetical protein
MTLRKDIHMSRYKFTTSEHTIVVGWDDSLHTYFAQVWKGDPESEQNVLDEEVGEPEPLFWSGTRPDEVRSLDALTASLTSYGQIPAETLKDLRCDYVRAHGYDVDNLKDGDIDRIGNLLDEGYCPSNVQTKPEFDPDPEPEF